MSANVQHKQLSSYVSNFYYVYDKRGNRHVKIGVPPDDTQENKSEPLLYAYNKDDELLKIGGDTDAIKPSSHVEEIQLDIPDLDQDERGQTKRVEGTTLLFCEKIPAPVHTEVMYYYTHHNNNDAWLGKAIKIASKMHPVLRYTDNDLKDLSNEIAKRIRRWHIRGNNKWAKKKDDEDFGDWVERHDIDFECNEAKEILEDFATSARAGDWLCHRLGANTATGKTKIRSLKYREAKFWRRKLRAVTQSLRENYLQKIGIIKKHGSQYSSWTAQQSRKKMLANQEAWAANNNVVSADGKYNENMLNIINENKRCYRAKIIAKTTGLNDYADKHGMTCALITITCPGTFRRDGTTIDEAIDYMRRTWKRTTAARLYDKINIGGFMVFQPHKDGYPHQHAFIIGEKKDIAAYYEIINNRAMAMYPNEPGAAKHRTDIIWEDREKGHLSSYALPYMIRMTEGADGGTLEVNGSAEDAWFCAHRVRRITSIGLPSDIHWSNCAKAKRWQVKDKKAKKMRKAARKGNYATWLELAGGLGVKRKDRKMSSIRVEGETEYGEKSWRYIGSEIHNSYIVVRGEIPMEIVMCSRSSVIKQSLPSTVKSKTETSVLPVSQSAAP